MGAVAFASRFFPRRAAFPSRASLPASRLPALRAHRRGGWGIGKHCPWAPRVRCRYRS